ncbi:fungal-specific transcription factor domain-containing protein [Mycena vitilis]|nr:fungal-specific transcription factor domain-containing protein [Mycena vitilis]
MSSNDEDSYGEGSEPVRTVHASVNANANAKQKRVQRACDMCRRKKRRCDGGDPCDHCAKHNFICTYITPTRPDPDQPSSSHTASGPSRAYVEALEARVKAAEALVAAQPLSQNDAQRGPGGDTRSPGVQLISNAIHRLNSPFPAPHSDDLTFAEIGASFRALAIDVDGDAAKDGEYKGNGDKGSVVGGSAAGGFQGKSSGAMLVKAAIDLRSANGKLGHASRGFAHPSGGVKVWSPPPPPSPTYTFPAPPLLAALIDLYFAHVNAFLPLLHRPTFDAAVRAGEHLGGGAGFAKVLLMVCAVGARYAIWGNAASTGQGGRGQGGSGVAGQGGLDGDRDAEAARAGWEWYDQVQLSGHLVRTHPTLCDLQAYCLAAMFLDCTSSPRTCWTLVGFGMRLSQDVGAHRFKGEVGARYRRRLALYSKMQGGGGEERESEREKEKEKAAMFEQELEKRAAWVLFLFDAQISTALGRCIALQSHDFDIEMPLIVDDAYWDPSNPSPTSLTSSMPTSSSSAASTPTLFKQPPGVPSTLAYFNCMLQLNRILSFSCKILYSTNRSKTLIGLGDDRWEEQVVVELDSALNTWFESVPEHLRWDPDNLIEDDTFFDQAAVLYCTYYHTRIIIHRPFIPAMRRAVFPTHLPSLAICNTAARACSHVAQVQQQRRPNNPLWFSQTPLFTSGIVLLLNIWGGASAGSGAGRLNAAEKDLADVHRCMAVLAAQRRQWPSAGALLDTLQQLVAADRPLGSATTQPQTQISPAPGIGLGSASFDMQDAAPSLPPQAQPTVDLGVHQQYVQNDFTLTPPMYDPALETAPPNLLSPNPNAWYNDNGASSASTSQLYGNDQQLFLDGAGSYSQNVAGPSTGYSNNYSQNSGYTHDMQDMQMQDLGFPAGWNANAEAYGFGVGLGGGEDWGMQGVDTQGKIELWSQAPTSFGVADWDMYLGKFVDDVQGQVARGRFSETTMHQSLDLRNISRLSPSLRVLAQRAADGSLEALSDFLLGIDTPNQFLLGLPVLFIHLDPSRIPSPSEFDSIISHPERTRELDPILGAVLCLHQISHAIYTSELPQAAYADLWPRLYRWMIFADLHLQCLPSRSQVVGPGPIQTCAVSSAILLKLGNYPGTSRLVRQAVGVRPILIKHWGALVDNNGVVAHEGIVDDQNGWPTMCSILAFLSEDDADSVHCLAELAEGVGGSQHELARLFMKQLNSAVAHCDSSPDLGATTLTTLLAVITTRSADSDDFNDFLLSLGLVPALIRAVRILEEYPRRTNPHDLGPAASIGFGLLVSRFQCDSGDRWLAQALEAGLMDLIVTLCVTRPQGPPSIVPSLKQMLGKVLPGYMVYYPVALQLKKSIPSALSAAASPAFKRCLVYDMWTKFVTLAGENRGALDFFESRDRLSARCCENMKCLRIGAKSDFQRCSGCSLAYYCSKECQKRDWDSLHKKWCGKLASIYFPGPISPRDRAFMRAVMQHNLGNPALNFDTIIQQTKFIYCNPGVGFFTVFDFTCSVDGIGWINVHPLSDFKAAEAPLRIAQLARSRRRLQLHTVVMNGGPRPFLRMLTMWTSSSRMLDGIYRIAEGLPPRRQWSELYSEAVLKLRQLVMECISAEVIVEVYQ